MRILIADPSRVAHYESVISYICRFHSDLEILHPKSHVFCPDCDLVLVSCEYYSPSSLLIADAKRKGIPTLHVIDGVLEWRNVWENPRTLTQHEGMPLFHPLLADKIACMGDMQARILSSFGNYSKVEVTGLPRLDYLAGLDHQHDSSASDSSNTFGRTSVLVATARTPYFTEKQRELVKYSLSCLNDYFKSRSDGDSFSVRWRVRPDLLPVDIPIESIDDGFTELGHQLRSCDFFISTPSTAVIEAMAHGIPTCMVDFTNSPAYIHAAWNITSRSHLPCEIESLLSRDASRMEFQRYLLSDQLRWDTSAAARVAQLAIQMIQISAKAREFGDLPVFPPLMVGRDVAAYSYPAIEKDFVRLFPSHPLFRRRSTDELNAEIGHLQLYAASLEASLESSQGSSARFRIVRALKNRLKSLFGIFVR